jgi:uncharacterized membrane protein
MPTTAWRFPGTEAADEAVMKLKQFNEQDLVNVEDMTVIRWPQYAAGPATDEHVTVQGGAMSSMMHKIKHAQIDSSITDAVKDDLMPGTSALVLQSSDAVLEALAEAVGGPGVQLLRSDLSIPEQDRLRAALEGPPVPPPDDRPPGGIA